MAKHESMGIPLPASSLPISDPSGPATCSTFLRPGIAACKGEPSRRTPHPCLNPDAGFLGPLSTRVLQGLRVPRTTPEDLGVRPQMAAPQAPDSLPRVPVCRPSQHPPGAAAHVPPSGPTSLT